MAAILDLITGGGLLPYVYCRKITLERNGDDTDVSMLLEIYQDSSKLSNSSWLNNLSTQNVNFLDSIFIQIVPFTKPDDIKKLFPSTKPLEAGGNVYTAKRFFVDGYLPRGAWGGKYDARNPGQLFDPLSTPGAIPSPIQVSNSSLAGPLAGPNGLLDATAAGKVRQEVKEGKPYYVIPFEYKYTYSPQNPGEENLGFLFYSFLHVPYWISNLEIDGNTLDEALYEDFFEQYVVEGPPNAEVVFMGGKIQQTREAFFMPDGLAWEGAVHHHASGEGGNPAPDGYAGDGGIGGTPVFGPDGKILDPGGDLRGWMAGETHIEGAAKLRLARVANNKIIDFRSGLFPEPLDTVLGLGQQTQVFNLSEPVQETTEFFVSQFQKEKKKDFVKDSDTEYSKLYISRDKNSNARGMFFLDIKELLTNNSSLYPLLSNAAKTAAVSNSRLLEIKVYRDRVKKKTIGPRREKYFNDTLNEEPPYLVGTISDEQAYKTPEQSVGLAEIDGLPQSGTKRYFMFSDMSTRTLSAGLYQYRVEVDFKDGTYEFLYDIYKELSVAKIAIESYHDLSTSNFSTLAGGDFNFNANIVADGYKKNIFRSYFDQGVFAPEFLVKAEEMFSEYKPWMKIPELLHKVASTFNIERSVDLPIFKDNPALLNLLSPENGSPEGINFFIRLVETSLNQIESLLGAQKVNKTGSELDTKTLPNNYTLNTQLDVAVSPGDYTIRETHTFDHPSELFEATSNKDIYVDYLSIGSPLLTKFVGLRPISTEYYVNRCRLDAAKYTEIAKTDDGFHGIGEENKIGAQGFFSGLVDDSLARTGYSYLAPSIVEMSNQVADYRYYYTCFSGQALSYLDSTEDTPISTLYSGIYHSFHNYDKLFMGLLNYTLNKQNNTDADLTDPFAPPETFDADIQIQHTLLNQLERREQYKRIFEEMNITVHEEGKHDLFFNKEAGAVSEDVPEEYREEPLSIEEYSDGFVDSVLFFNNFLSNKKQTLLNVERNFLSPEGYNIELPNNFKIGTARGSRKASGKPDILQESLRPIFDNPENSNNNSFVYFNVNMTAKIEVFTGTEGNAKNDLESWKLLTQEDLSFATATGAKLFCRLSLYDENLSRNIKLPTLDKYFLIYEGASNLMPPVMPQPSPDYANFSTGGGEFWDQQATLKKEKEKAMTQATTLENNDTNPGAGTPNIE